MKNIITIDHYPKNDKIVVFVDGFALGKASCTVSIACKIAKNIGQSHIPVKTYGEGPPKISTIEV